MYSNEFTGVAIVHSAVLRKRNFAILGEWLPGVCYLEAKMRDGAPFGAVLSAVRNREASAMVFSIRNMASVGCSLGVRFSEGPLWEVPL